MRGRRREAGEERGRSRGRKDVEGGRKGADGLFNVWHVGEHVFTHDLDMYV